MRRRLTATLVALAVSAPSLAADPAPSVPTTGQGAEWAVSAEALAAEEARLRERIVLALAVAESVRLRGRTILVAMSEIERVRARIATLAPDSGRRAEFDQRLAALEARRVELDREVDEEFLSYVTLVSDLAAVLFTRVNRVGDSVHAELEGLAMRRLTDLYPLLSEHIEEFNRDGGVGREATDRWRREIDDTYEMRRARAGGTVPSEPAVGAGETTEKDI